MGNLSHQRAKDKEPRSSLEGDNDILKIFNRKKADEPNRTHSKVVDFNPAPERRDFPIRHVG